MTLTIGEPISFSLRRLSARSLSWHWPADLRVEILEQVRRHDRVAQSREGQDNAAHPLLLLRHHYRHGPGILDVRAAARQGQGNLDIRLRPSRLAAVSPDRRARAAVGGVPSSRARPPAGNPDLAMAPALLPVGGVDAGAVCLNAPQGSRADLRQAWKGRGPSSQHHAALGGGAGQ